MKTLVILAILTALFPLTQSQTAPTEPKRAGYIRVVRDEPVAVPVQTSTTTISFPESQLDMNWVENEISKVELPEPPLTLQDLVDKYFEPEDRQWALRVAFCESTGFPEDITSDAVNRSSGAAGWFQHLPKFWEERSTKAGIPGGDIMDPENNVYIASWLLYETSQGTSHWYPSEHCWGE